MVRFLADECCDFAVVKALREAGFEVQTVSDLHPQASDAEVIRLALKEKFILLTEDKDFGQLVYSHGQKFLGVVLLRFPSAAAKQVARDVVRLVNKLGDTLAGCFITVQPGKIRMTRPIRNQPKK